MSAAIGPITLIPLFLSFFIAGMIIDSSSLNLDVVSQCGFKPVTANLGFKPNFFT